MNRIDRRFAELRAGHRAALIPYVTAGHPDPACTVPVMRAAVAAGADLLELGIPFSDMTADGPVIQKASIDALARGTDIGQVLAAAEEFRREDDTTPVVLMGYMNPLERRGLKSFAGQAAAAGVDGVLVVDCPLEEAAEMRAILAASGLHQIFLVAPTTTPQRLARVAAIASGFIYYVSLKGVTGADRFDLEDIGRAVDRVRSAIDLPVAVGFGIRTVDQAAGVARLADAVVIGTALVEILDRAGSARDAVSMTTGFLAPLRAAMDNA